MNPPLNPPTNPRRIGLVLAAGKGTRMKSDLAKVLHEFDGRTLLGHVLETAGRLMLDRTVVVVGHQAEQVQSRHGADGVDFVRQEPQLGTGHAVMGAAPLLAAEPDHAELLVLYGDVPNLRETTLLELFERHRLEGNGVTVLTAELEHPAGYGRVLRDGAGRFDRIVEDRDLSPEQRGEREINSGIYVFQLGPLRSALGELRADNAQKEYYLTDALTIIRQRGLPVGILRLGDEEEIAGINTPEQLAEAAAVRARRRQNPEEGCPVCRTLRERSDLLLFERAEATVLLAPSPYNCGHLWIAPRRHVVSFLSLREDETGILFQLAAEVERWLDEAYHPQAFNLGYNSGRAGEHLVLQVIPRWSGDANFMPLVGGANILPQSLAGSRKQIEEARGRLDPAGRSGPLREETP